MNLLAIDCASSFISVAVKKRDNIYYMETATGSHSENVMTLIDDAIKEAAILPSALNGVLCMEGPGSFTGLRIGYSIAKGLALSLCVPIAAVPTLDCIAYSCRSGHHNTGTVLAVVQSIKKSWYYAFYQNGNPLKPATDAGTLEIEAEIKRFTAETGKVTLAGPGAISLFESFPSESRENLVLECEKQGFAREMIFIAKARDLLDNVNTVLYSGPEYIRSAV
ncbi:MAG: tRNA (adenosine(37)-N6)-threonylcarbamoyltransferase complex dimerization subunit type 1 TsaB [Treponema sp.]|jgi:tRNA threonylcarbamoyladenosine biosynthesis protein TsaB|nr:tRNA (adenosine(37)-N6)-threonylcarbamoyltransferase complex dimerization subunit type 1 TsaB [Treponema sp.]